MIHVYHHYQFHLNLHHHNNHCQLLVDIQLISNLFLTDHLRNILLNYIYRDLVLIDNNLLAEKKVVTIDNVKYEKIQFLTEMVIDHRILTNLGAAKVGMSSGTLWKFCGDFKGEYGYQCIPIFKAKTPQIHIAEGNVLTNQWTILRVMN